MTATATTLNPPREIETIALVGFAHGTSHFFHLLIPPLFPWLMAELSLSFTEAGSLMTLFFLVSGVGQAAAGFVVDRMGARRVLFAGVGLAIVAALLVAAAQSYGMLALAALTAGLGNSVFHPADFSILNHRISKPRLGHAFSVHGLSGNLGWAVAPVLLTGIVSTAGWKPKISGGDHNHGPHSRFDGACLRPLRHRYFRPVLSDLQKFRLFPSDQN